MTEHEWLSCSEPLAMVAFLRRGAAVLVDQEPSERREVVRQHLLGITKPRKLGLFACGCCRVLWSVIGDEQSRRAVEYTEQHLDGVADPKEGVPSIAPVVARGDATRTPGLAARAVARTVMRTVWLDVEEAVEEAAVAAAWAAIAPDLPAAQVQQATILRDIVGNPFRPIVFEPSWRTDTAVAMARQMYDTRDFSPMPILADALMDAGCDDEAVLEHCRGPNVHTRGCHVVDMILGRE